MIDSAIFLCKGAGSPPKPPAPPSPTSAAENFAKSEINQRNRRARGFGQSMIGSYAQGAFDRPQTLLKSLLGE